MRARHLAWLAGLGLAAAAVPGLADAKSDALVNKAKAAAAKAKSLQARIELTMGEGAEKQTLSGDLVLLKPNIGRISLSPAGGGAQTLISTGTDTFIVFEDQKEYLKQEGGANSFGAGMPLVDAFLRPDRFFASGTHSALGTEKIGGKNYQAISWKQPGFPGEMKLYFGPSGLVEGAAMTMKQENFSLSQAMWMKDLKLNPPLKAEQFAYVPPAGFKVMEQPDPEKDLLAVGTDAPDFNLPQPGGGRLALSDLRKGKKAVLVNFWFYN